MSKDENSDESELSASGYSDEPAQYRGVLHSKDAARHTTAIPTVAGFADMEELREELWSAIEEVWPDVVKCPCAANLDTVFDLDASVGKRLSRKAEQHPGFSLLVGYLQESAGESSYVRAATTLTEVGLGRDWMANITRTVPFRDLTRFEQLGGRCCSTKVRLNTSSSHEYFVFKGIDLRTYLTNSDGEEDHTVKGMIKTWHHSNKVVSKMPRHDRILAPATTAVTFPAGDGTEVVCGCLYPFQQQGDVGCLLEKSNEEELKLRSRRSAAGVFRWRRLSPYTSSRPHLPYGHEAWQLPHR